MPRAEHWRAVYRRHFRDQRRERVFLSSVSFFITIASARGLTFAIKKGISPVGNVSAGGKHIHHSAWGVLALIGIGWVWLLRLGTGSGSGWGSRGTSIAYGSATALIFDELDLWLLQKNEYWKGKGRANVAAALLFGSLLLLAVAGCG
ncbi:MAG TPA: hypothetical protein VKU87_01765, partial [Thermomicrobiaceae bacterium]|nr:hypothetical protein [Thermomicrobiaceae bacterium]